MRYACHAVLVRRWRTNTSWLAFGLSDQFNVAWAQVEENRTAAETQADAHTLIDFTDTFDLALHSREGTCPDGNRSSLFSNAARGRFQHARNHHQFTGS